MAKRFCVALVVQTFTAAGSDAGRVLSWYVPLISGWPETMGTQAVAVHG